MSESGNLYDFEVFKALVELEIKRSYRYGHKSHFSIAFLYAPDLALRFKENPKIDEEGLAFVLKDNIRAVDVISPVEEDFVFLFFPETGKEEAKKVIQRIKKILGEDIIHGVATFPEDGKDKNTLFEKLVQIMNEKLIPIIELK